MDFEGQHAALMVMLMVWCGRLNGRGKAANGNEKVETKNGNVEMGLLVGGWVVRFGGRYSRWVVISPLS